MADIQRVLDATETVVTDTNLGTSMANGDQWASDAIDVESSAIMDLLVGGSLTTGTGSPTGTFQIYAAGSIDGGTTFSGNASGSEGEDNNIVLSQCFTLGVLSVDTASTAYEFGPYSMRQAFGELPDQVVIIVVNETGEAMAANTSQLIHYKIVKYTIA